MKKLFSTIVLGFLLCQGLYARNSWLPGFIRDSSIYQGDQSTMNIASGTIKTLNADTVTASTFTGTFDGTSSSATYADNAGLWDSLDSGDYLDQGVRTTDDPTFAGINVGLVVDVTASSITIRSGILHVGSGGTVDYADGDGDVYIKDELEVDGNTRLNSLNMIGNAVFQTWEFADSGRLNNDIKFGFGTSGATRFSAGFVAASNVLVFNHANDLTIDEDTVLKLNANSTVIKSSTTAGLDGTTPIEEGEIYYVNDSGTEYIAISTGTGAGNFGWLTLGSHP